MYNQRYRQLLSDDLRADYSFLVSIFGIFLYSQRKGILQKKTLQTDGISSQNLLHLTARRCQIEAAILNFAIPRKNS